MFIVPCQLKHSTKRSTTCARMIQISSIRLLNAQMLKRDLLAFVIFTEVFTELTRTLEYIVISNENQENILIHGKCVQEHQTFCYLS